MRFATGVEVDIGVFEPSTSIFVLKRDGLWPAQITLATVDTIANSRVKL